MKKKWLGTFSRLWPRKVNNLKTVCLIFGLSVAIQLQAETNQTNEGDGYRVSENSDNFSDLTNQQDGKTVNGTVVDQDGAPIPGVTIIVKGSTIGTVTDMDGKFQLNDVPEDGILRVSFIGMQEVELTVAGKTTFNVTLQSELQDIDEVVVIGYGVQKKSSLTGAVAQVKSEDMENRTISNPLQALAGKASGVQVYSSSGAPGSSPTIRIRGVNSNNGGTPLYVVDGRVASSISGIEPNDIENMEILKDAASAAIYGAQAGNGVILITTKKGKKGTGTITYDYQYTSQSIGKMPHVMNSEQYIDYFTAADKFSMDLVYKYWDFEQNTNWIEEIFRPSVMQRHSINFQGGNEKGNYYLSGSMLDNDGMVVGDADVYKRYTGMINGSYNVKPWLEVGSNNQIEYYKSRSVSEGSEYGSLILSTLQLDPMTPVTYTEDNMTDDMAAALANYRETGVGELLSDGNGNYYSVSPYVTSENINPLIMRDRSYSESSGFNVNGTAYLNIKPTNGLVITSRISYLLGMSESYGYDNDYYANSMAHQLFMNLSASTYNNTRLQWENFANYTRSFGQHNLTAMLGTSFTKIRSYGVSGSKNGTEDVFGVQMDDERYYYFAYAMDEAVQAISGGEPDLEAQNAYFGRLSYDYKDKYLAQFSLRADAFDSSYLPEANRWGYFPAGSLGWVISKESFMESTSQFIDHLKLRASWGQNGSLAGLGSWAYLTSVASTGSYPYSSSAAYNIGYKPSYTGNEELKWETHEQTNIGIDARLLNSRLSLAVDYFNKKTKDLIMVGVTPSYIVGNSASPMNAGNIVNSGFEFELGWNDRRGDFSYGIRGNLSTVHNEVTNIHQSLPYIAGASYHTTAAITRFEVGKPAWYFNGWEFAGIDEATGDPLFVDQNDDDVISAEDRVELGKGIPDFTYGITLNAEYKGFDVIVFGQGSQGNDVFACLNRTDYAVNSLTHFTENRWTETNTTGTTPRAGANDLDKYYASSAGVFDGSYFKIKQLQLGYTLPKSLLDKVGIKNLRIYGSLEDYFTFTNYIGFDPEVTGVGSSLGVDKGSYPSMKKVIFGLNVSF
ncbi:SusC/RagA family TonB-linked outer membrane protein [Carboxylicivirga caseinilyticus]|uniref:SusC/RagA family TonB-linked outer membrane protein n=1 Tax=Carboxylicivirga caseinilyticus TaxID=3417572 RepID=UPI003D3336C6|nr:TonB-dependent receptor [Marinilabiliaceae bacterium A049]